MDKIIILVLCFVQSTVLANINFTEYYQMPEMYNFEPYERCMNEMPQYEAVYCMVNALIAPNTSNPTWNIIQKYSADAKRHYRHDMITRGICMNSCRKNIMRLSKLDRLNYYYKKSNTSDLDIVNKLITIDKALVSRAKYHETANLCSNLELKNAYELMAETSVDYCISNRDVTEYDTVDGIFAVLVAFLLVLIGASSAYDVFLKQNNLPLLRNNEHYKRTVPGKSTTFMVSFSLARSWYRLIGDSNNEVSRDLRPINSIRSITMFGIFMAHVGIMMNASPVMNTEFMENKFHSFWSTIITNGAIVLQLYFAIAGFLLTIQFVEIRDKMKFNWAVLWKSIIYRYLRSAPLYAFVIFLHSTWIVKLQDGPFWPRVADLERQMCRQNWWTNLLFINNFVHTNQPCAQHTWYLAADLQLVILATVLHILMWRFPSYTRELIGLSIISSFVVQGYVIYTNKFEGIFMATPEKLRHLYVFDDAYHVSYIPFYMNAGSFFLGLAGGMIYSENKKGNMKLHENKILPVLWYGTAPACVMVILSGFIFYTNDFEKPALWIAIYAAVSRNIWGVALPILVIGITTGSGWLIRDIFRLPIFRALGRLSFAAYLIHPLILRLFSGNIRVPFFISHLNIVGHVISLYVMSFAAAMILALAIEIPLASIQKTIFRREQISVNSTKADPVNGISIKECSLELAAKDMVPTKH